MIEENLDKWWAYAEDDPQRNVREPTRSRLNSYFVVGWKRKQSMEFLLKLAELMIFDPSSPKKQEANVSTLCHSALHFYTDKEGLHQYVSGITALLDRLESEMGDDGFDLKKYRKKLNRFNAN